MIKTQALIQIKKNEREYNFYCDNDSPLGEAYESIKEIMGIIIEKMQQANNASQEVKMESD